MDLGLQGKRALVTGSTAGIGWAVARALAAEGAEVTVNGRTEDRVRAAVEAVSREVPAARVHGVAADLSSAAGCQALIAQVPELDVLVNNMGIFEPKPFTEITDADWLRFFETNVLSGVRLARHYMAGMRARNWGRIVFVSSESAAADPGRDDPLRDHEDRAARGRARPGGDAPAAPGSRSTACCLDPRHRKGSGRSSTQLAQARGIDAETVEREFFATARPSSIIQRFATPAEVAAMIVYVCSTQASATTGAALRVDGGVVRAI